MELKMIREIVHVDENHQVHINVPKEMGDEFEIILIPLHSQSGDKELTEEDRFKLTVYATLVDEDEEEDAIWERYSHQ